MGILIYLIILRIKRIFDFKSHPIKTISIVFLFGVSVYYGYLFAYLFNSPDFQEKALSQNEFKHYLILSLAIITFIRGFFPSYIPLKNIIGKSYPLSKLERFAYNIINEFIYPFYFGIILFVGTLYIGMNQKDIEFSVIAFCWILISHLIKRLVQLLLEYRLKGINSIWILVPIILFIIFYQIFFSDILQYFNYVISISAIAILISINYLFENKCKEPKILTKTNSKKSSTNFYFLKLLLNNKSLRTMSLTSIAYKIFIFFLAWNILQKDGGYSPASEFILYLFISPVVLFSYIFNNFFGFSRTMWFSLNKVGADLLTYSKEILKVLFVPLIIDALLTLVFFVISGKLDFANISFYLSNAIVLFALGVFNSFYFPKEVKGLFTMTGNTSLLGVLISMFAIGVIVLLTKYFVYASLLVSIIIAVGLYFLTKDKILKTRYKLFKKLYS